MYGNYNQMSSSHQEGYYHSAQTNVNDSQLYFPNAFPPPHQYLYSNIDYHPNVEDAAFPPPLPAEQHPPPPSPFEFDASSDKDLINGNSGHSHSIVNNLKHARKSKLSPSLTTRLQSSLRYLLPEIKRNKPSSSVLKVISRALHSPGKACDPVTSPSLSHGPAIQSLVTEGRMSENTNERKSSLETPRKSETCETSERVFRNLKLGTDVVVVKDAVNSEPKLHILSESQEQREDMCFQHVPNKSVSSKLITDFEPGVQERGMNNLKCSGQSQVPLFSSEHHDPTSRHKLKTVPSFILSRIPIHNKDSPLGESDADCKMFSSTGALSDSLEDRKNEIVSKQINENERQQVQLSPFSTHVKCKPVVLNLIPRNDQSKFSHFQSNEGNIKCISSRQTEDLKHEPSVSVQQSRVREWKHASFKNVRVDEGTVKVPMVDKSVRMQSTNSSDEKCKTAFNDILISESDTLVSAGTEASPFTSIPRCTLSHLLAGHEKNLLSDGDDIHQSVPAKMSRARQDVEANSSVFGITGHCSTVNIADALSHRTVMEQTDCSASMKSNADGTQPKQLQDHCDNANIGEQRPSTSTKNMEMRESCHESDEGNSGGDFSEIEIEKKEKISAVIRNGEASALLAENSSTLPQVYSTKIATFGREIKDKATILCGERSVAGPSQVSVVTSEKTSTIISKSELKEEVVHEIEDKEFDPEGTNVQTSVLVKEENKEICVSQMKCKRILELGGKKKYTLLCAGVESASEDCSEGTVTETGRTDVLENTYEVSSKENMISMTENGNNERIISSIVAQLPETVNTELGTKSEETVASELVVHEKPSLSNAAAFVPEENFITSEGSENTVVPVPTIGHNKTSLPKLGGKEGSALLLKAGTSIAEESKKEMAVSEIEKEDAVAVSKVETYMHEKECTKPATLKTEMVDEDIASIEPEIEREKTSASLHGIKHEEIIRLIGDGSENAEKCVIQERLHMLKIEHKEESHQQIKKYVLDDTAACMSSETKFPLTAVNNSGTGVLVKLKEQDTGIPLTNSLSVIAMSRPRNKSSNNVQVPSVQEELMAMSPVQVSGNISQDDIFSRKPKSPEKRLSVTSSSEVEVVRHLGSISPSGNKENLPVMTANSSVYEHPTSSELHVGNTKSQPLNVRALALNIVPAENTPEEQVTRTETKKLNLDSEPERSGIVKTLGLELSLDKEWYSSQLTHLQGQPQGTTKHYGISAVIKSKDVNMYNTKPAVDLSTSKLCGNMHGIRSRRNDNFEICITNKCRLVPKLPKKSAIYKSVTLKQFQTSESVIKLNNTEILGNSPSSYIKNCNKLVAHTSSKHVKGLDPSTLNPQGLESDSSKVTKVMSDKTLHNNITSADVCKYVRSAMPNEPLRHTGTKQGAFKKRNCHMLSDILENLCLVDSTLLNGKWLVFFELTPVYFLCSLNGLE
jgi:hypothetical protein